MQTKNTTSFRVTALRLTAGLALLLCIGGLLLYRPWNPTQRSPIVGTTNSAATPDIYPVPPGEPEYINIPVVQTDADQAQRDSLEKGSQPFLSQPLNLEDWKTEDDQASGFSFQYPPTLGTEKMTVYQMGDFDQYITGGKYIAGYRVSGTPPYLPDAVAKNTWFGLQIEFYRSKNFIEPKSIYSKLKLASEGKIKNGSYKIYRVPEDPVYGNSESNDIGNEVNILTTDGWFISILNEYFYPADSAYGALSEKVELGIGESFTARK